jgi:EAL domain-containing protein (putative c-di-GMP-specific phosphodiesterase class I)
VLGGWWAYRRDGGLPAGFPAAAPVTIDGALFRERLRGGGLRMLMQPIIDLRSGEVRHVEALARLSLDHGAGQLVAPPVFLPHLDADDIDLLFRQGLDQALAALVGWEARGLRLVASVNLSPSTLRDPHCADRVGEMLDRHGLSGDRLVLELLETDVLKSSEELISLARLRGLGVALALDDFGSGHSNPARLAVVAVDFVKLDRALTSTLRPTRSPELDAVTDLVDLGRAAGCQVIMEGIEGPGQLEVAEVLDADLGQGFYIAHPMPADQLPAWSLAHRTRWRAIQRGASG